MRELLAATKDGVRPADVAARLAERDRRMALDTRTKSQKLLGDPPPGILRARQEGSA